MENVLDFVKEKWKQLTAFSNKEEIKKQLWEEIVYRYSEQHRHYHNLTHIGYLFDICGRFIDRIKNPAVVGFAILYHDIIYDTYRKDNEEQSAAIAESHLKQLNLNPSIIQNVKAFILATQDHLIPEGYAMAEDLALFLDFDLAILGADEHLYKLYSEKIRKEFSKYPDEVYNEGRKVALEKILATEFIFATDDFRIIIEDTARENMKREIGSLKLTGLENVIIWR